MKVIIFIVSLVIVLLNLLNLQTAIQLNDAKVAARISFVCGTLVSALLICAILYF